MSSSHPPAMTNSPVHSKESTVRAAAPVLTRQGLIWLLTVMCLVPLVTLIVLQLTMPPVRPGSLAATVKLLSVPPRSYYETPLAERIEFPDASIEITNTGENPWTHINVRINNGHYQIYEYEVPLEPGQSRSFLLDRFVNRSGAVFRPGIVRPHNVEIYARLPDRSRGTFEQELE
ncbi:MAG: hypothetical protein ACR2NP_14725 [Pirellulaceae bacterium]